MAYEKTEWISGETALSADNLNKIENELEILDTAVQQDMIKVIEFKQTNVEINPNSTTTVIIDYTIPSGFNTGYTVAWGIEGAGTTQATNQSWCVVYNHWIGISDNKIHASIKNYGQSKAKVTVNIRMLFFRSSQ